MQRTRVFVEIFHCCVWVYLVLAMLFASPRQLGVPLIVLVSIPLAWKCFGECPLTMLENKIAPLKKAEILQSRGQNRWGAFIRSYTRFHLKEWDTLLGFFVALVSLVCLLRVCSAIS